MLLKKSLIIVTVLVMLLAIPVSALAASITVAGITLTYPGSYVSCTPADMITVSGVTQPIEITFWRYDAATNWMYLLGSVTTSTDGSWAFPYPNPINGTLTFSVQVRIISTNTKFAGQWSVSCTPVGGQGCTPGYWRQPQHMDDWVPTGYAPSDIFDNVFTTSYFSPTFNLLQAIWANGGGLDRLARHGTAALLSAASPFVDYPYTVAEVIAMVQSGTIDPLAQANELGCPLH